MSSRSRAASRQCKASLTVILGLLAVGASAGGPVVFWESQPARPDDTVIVTGHGLGGTDCVEVGRVEDARITPALEAPPAVAEWHTVTPAIVSDESVHFVVPESFDRGLYAYRFPTDSGSTPLRVINAPDVWWTQGDQGQGAASPGGWLRVFGRCLEGPAPRIVLQGDDGDIELSAQRVRDEPNAWALTCWLPADLVPGEYGLLLHNGYGGGWGWCSAGGIRIQRPEEQPSGRFSVADFREGEATDTEAIQAALSAAEANGGGTVWLPRGAYRLDDTLTIPRFVTLRGEAEDLVSLTWADRDEPLSALIRGTNHFAVESLTIYAHNHLNGIVSDRGNHDDAGHVRISRVRMRLDRLALGRRFEDALTEAERRGRIEGRAAAIQTGGDDVQVTDCDIFISPLFKHGSILGFIFDRVRGGVIARNRVYGPARATIMTKGGDGIIFEDNDLMGGGFMGTHHTPGDELGGGGSLINPVFQNLYYARNRVHDNNWWDRELFALDSHGPAGAYEGRVESAEGTMVVLADDPRYPGEGWRRWLGAGLYVLDGRGAGQYRRIVGGEGREVQVDRDWLVPTDESSRISIAKFHGRMLLVNNEFSDGGNVMLWAGAIDSVIAGNRVQRIGSILSTTSYIYSGLMPVWHAEFLDNEVLEGNGSFGGSTGIGHSTYDSDRFYDVFDGFLTRGVVLRGNAVDSDGRLYISGAVRDAVVEHNRVRRSDGGIQVSSRKEARPEFVLIRANEIEEVGQPLGGDCLDRAVVR